MDRWRRSVALGALGVLVFAGLASAQPKPAALVADYRFQDSLASSAGGGQPLTEIGAGAAAFVNETVDGQERKVYSFPVGNGVEFAIDSLVPNDSYSFVVLFRFELTNGYKRVAEFAGGTSDMGLYSQYNNLNFWPVTTGPPSICPMTYVQVAMTRASDQTVRGYVDGRLVFEFQDTQAYSNINPDFNVVRFFRDNDSGGVTNEHSAGAVARLRIYSDALTPEEVAGLDRLPGDFQEPATGNAICGSDEGETITGTAADETIYAGAGDDTIDGGGGNDTVIGGAGDDTVVGGIGNDLLYGDESIGTQTARLAGGRIRGNDILDGGDGDDLLFGGGGLDTVIGGVGGDFLSAGGEVDELFGGEGTDKLDGGKGEDRVKGEKGDDRVAGGPGEDYLDGGAGEDTCIRGNKEKRIRLCEKIVKRNNQRPLAGPA